MKWNESGFTDWPLVCTYMLNWAKRTSWGCWDDTALPTRDSKFKPWRSEAEHATSRSQRLPTILSFTSGWGRNIFVFKLPRPGNEPKTLARKTDVLTTTLVPKAPPKSSGIKGIKINKCQVFYSMSQVGSSVPQTGTNCHSYNLILHVVINIIWYDRNLNSAA